MHEYVECYEIVIEHILRINVCVSWVHKHVVLFMNRIVLCFFLFDKSISLDPKHFMNKYVTESEFDVN